MLLQDNVVFFTPLKCGPDYATQLLCGYEYAQPDLSDEPTEEASGSQESGFSASIGVGSGGPEYEIVEIS